MATRERAIPFGGTGGTELNFEVVGGITAPTAFKTENVIWINTDNKNPSYILSHEEPANQSNCWIPIDYNEGSVSFNALAKNGLIVHPLQPRQWDNGRWKRASGALYQNGVITQTYSLVPDYLYNAGNQYVNDTGGWTIVTTGGFWYWGNEWNTGNTKTTPVFNDSNIELATGGSYYMGTIRTQSAIDFSNISKLIFNFDITKYPGSYTTCYQSVNCAIMSDVNTSPTIVASNMWKMNESGTGKSIELDVANYNDSYYVYFGVSSGAGYTSRIQLTSIQVNS